MLPYEDEIRSVGGPDAGRAQKEPPRHPHRAAATGHPVAAPRRLVVLGTLVRPHTDDVAKHLR